jgi:ubiquinone/menaquinone biosynthesis C-methylase UbiE
VKRTLEVEAMDTEEEALDYDAMNHADVNTSFCTDLIASLPLMERGTQMCDLGTGTARIPIELCKRLSMCRVMAIDLSREMIKVAERNVQAAGMNQRVFPLVDDAKALKALAGGLTMDAVFSNSVVHHIPEPEAFLREAFAHVGAGGVLFVRDLVRPETPEEATRLADLYAPLDRTNAAALATSTRQRDLLLASLHAALTVAEVLELVVPLGIPANAVKQTSDRHWTLVHRKAP